GAGLSCGLSPVLAELTRAIEIRSLSHEEAEAGLDVRIQGTVTFIEGPNAVFVQDETAGTFFRPAPGDELRPGAIVEVTGMTHVGMYLPGIGPAPYRIIGYGPLLPAIQVGYAGLTEAGYNYPRVAIEGIVRSVTANGGGRSVIRIAIGCDVVEARVDSEIAVEGGMVDCRVRAEGLAAGGINRRRQ